jgi:hypothetical protein
LHVGTDYSMWAVITGKPKNGAHITTEWLPTSTRISSLCGCLGILAPKLDFGYVAITFT